MAGILIVAHAPLASALKECAAHIYGALPERVAAFDIVPGIETTQLAQEGRAQLLSLIKENGAVVLTDVFGGTPSNVAAQLAISQNAAAEPVILPNIKVLAGVNLPMLLRTICYRSTPLDQLVDKVLTGGVHGIQLIDPRVVLTEPSLPLSVSCLSKNHAAARNSHCK